MTWLRRYWPWLAGLGWLVGYELYALVTRIDGIGLSRPPTLSQMVWHGQAAWPFLIWVVTGVVVILWIHFFVRRKKVQP